ncbi:MAG: ribosome recycling factor [Myxococcales bacterium]|nr:ribosome recycling factor [Myxococcales bacterium]MCB9537793.1 ribosome recycling factor [Myxococcales bacterium]
MLDEIQEDLKANFQKAFDALSRELARVRSGRANINLLDNIRVPYYGQPTPLSQMAALQVPEPRMITIKPWESNLLKDIERAILQSDLGLTPSNDGTLIRLHIPPLTEDRRRDLVKQVKAHGEDAKISIRNSRRDANSTLKDLEKDSDITEDDLQRGLKVVQEMTDEAVARVDTIIAKKETELMEV